MLCRDLEDGKIISPFQSECLRFYALPSQPLSPAPRVKLDDVRRGRLTMNRTELKLLLDRLYESYPFAGRVAHDPVRFPLSYPAHHDREAAGFVASALAYGRVSLFSSVLTRIFDLMGPSPRDFIASFNPVRDIRKLSGIRYRFNSTADIAALIHITGSLILRHGTLESAFTRHRDPDDADTGGMISGFVEEALEIDTASIYGDNTKPAGLRQLFPSPAGGGASKRICLYLRWMVRRGDIDMGLWRTIDPSMLVIPLDTHIARISRCLGLTSRKANDWRTALEITDSLRALDPLDPLKYDFALCHLGISGECGPDRCAQCIIRKKGA